MTPDADAVPPRPAAVPVRLAAALLLVLLAAPPCAAGERPGWRWSVAGYGLRFEPAGDQTRLDRPTFAATQVVDQGASGYGAELELRCSRWLSVFGGVFFFDLDSELTAGDGAAVVRERQSLGVYAPYLGADWHFAPDSRVDFRLGVFFTQLNYEDVTFFRGSSAPEVLRYDDDVGIGLRFGIDWTWSLDGPWSLRTEVRYLDALLESENAGEDLDLDPLVLSAGVAYRW